MKKTDKVKAENFAMKAEIAANGGWPDIADGLSPLEENDFLKHILEIEGEPDTRIGDLLPDFKPEKELSDEEVVTELDRLVTALEKKRVVLALPDGIPDRIAYRYLTENIVNDMITVPLSGNSFFYLDGCTGWCPECSVADYCEIVKEIWTWEELERG